MNSVQQRTWWGGRRRVEDREVVPVVPAPLPVAPLLPQAMFPTGISGVPVVSPANALAVADVFACVRCLSDAAASIPLIPYRKTADGRTRASGSLSDLLRRPSPGTTLPNLIGTAMAHLNLYGNCFIGKFRDADGRVGQLALLHPDRVGVELRDGRPVYAVNDGFGRQSEHGVEDIVHVRGLSTDGLVGLSPVRQCRVAMDLSASLAAHANHFFQNGARPTGILRTPPFADQAAEDAFGAEFGANELGLRNAHKIAVVTSNLPLDFIQLTGPLDDLQFVEQRHLSTAEIARIFRVPPWMVGASSGDSMTYSNTESQALAFVTHSLRPWLVLIEQAISEDADLCPGAIYVEFLLDALLRADSKTRSEVYTAALDPATGWMTREEVRRLENLEPEPPTTTTETFA
ncbi:MAG: phage portal protein [Solirubrobacteraceae bacterium]